MDLTQEFQLMIARAINFLPHLITAVITFVLTLILANGASRWVTKRSFDRVKDASTRKLMANVARWLILTLGIVLALEQVNFNVTGFVAGLGIAGFTIGFALQDISKNFVSGMLILLRQPFKIGDSVELSSFQGTVAEITLRDTVLKTWDGEVVILPNASVYANPIKNFSGLTDRRQTVRVGVGYEDNLENARQKILESVQSVEGVLEQPQAGVLASEFGPLEIVLSVTFWVDQTKHSPVKVLSDVIQSIKQTADRGSLHLTQPIQSVQLAAIKQKTE